MINIESYEDETQLTEAERIERSLAAGFPALKSLPRPSLDTKVPAGARVEGWGLAIEIDEECTLGEAAELWSQVYDEEEGDKHFFLDGVRIKGRKRTTVELIVGT